MEQCRNSVYVRHKVDIGN